MLVLERATIWRRFEAKASSVPKARRMVTAIPVALPGDLVGRLELIISELVTNAIVHARTPFEVAVRLYPTVRVEVGDGSRDRPRLGIPGLSTVGGRGLVVVDSFAERWGFELTEQGKIVWADLGTV